MEEHVMEATIYRLSVALLPLASFTSCIDFAAECETLITELSARCVGLTPAELHSTAIHILSPKLAPTYTALVAYWLASCERAMGGVGESWWARVQAGASLRASRIEAVQFTALRLFRHFTAPEMESATDETITESDVIEARRIISAFTGGTDVADATVVDEAYGGIALRSQAAHAAAVAEVSGASLGLGLLDEGTPSTHGGASGGIGGVGRGRGAGLSRGGRGRGRGSIVKSAARHTSTGFTHTPAHTTTSAFANGSHSHWQQQAVAPAPAAAEGALYPQDTFSSDPLASPLFALPDDSPFALGLGLDGGEEAGQEEEEMLTFGLD